VRSDWKIVKPIAIVTPWFARDLIGGAEQQTWQLVVIHRNFIENPKFMFFMEGHELLK
jgi:hypothetical protein